MMSNHNPAEVWDPMVDYAMMSRNVRAFMSLFHCSKPVVCKVHGFCVAGGTDMALCSDLLVIAADAKIGYPPARVWGSPTTSMWAYRLGAQRAKRLLFTGDSLSGAEALEWGLAIEAPAPDELDERAEALVERIARLPVNQLQMMKLLVNQSLYSQGLHATQLLGTVFDGITRHTKEGYAFQAPGRARGLQGRRARARRTVRGLRPMTEVLIPTRDRLLQAARELIEEDGYGGASVVAIAERAGVASGTLYRHFASKEELFVDLFRSVCDREVRAMRTAAEQMPEGSSHVDRLETVLATFARRALRRPRLAWALIAEPVDPLVDAERLAYRERYQELTAAALRAGIEAGEIPDQNVELTAAALVGGCGEALVGPLSPLAGAKPSVNEILAALRTFVRRAVGADTA